MHQTMTDDLGRKQRILFLRIRKKSMMAEKNISFPHGLVISAPSSGTGKTTVMLGLLRLLTRNGTAVHPFKSGPDYIDPAFHQAACGIASSNLDGWAMKSELLDHITAQAAAADLILTEGSMGLFDGVAQPGETGTGATAEIAMRYGWPVILVVDASGPGPICCGCGPWL